MRTYIKGLGASAAIASLFFSFSPAQADSLSSTPPAEVNTSTAVSSNVSTSSVGATGTPINDFWLNHLDDLGVVLTAEQCYSNGSCEQGFENGLVTWNARNGVHVLTDPSEIYVFLAAGGVEKFGALESDSWNHSYCGQSVTTYDGTNRWLIIVSPFSANAGSFINLDSPEAIQWKAERISTGGCFQVESSLSTVAVPSPLIPVDPSNSSSVDSSVAPAADPEDLENFVEV